MLFTNFEKYLKECRGAIHIGAHIGEERNWYIQNGFTKVIWFEPNTSLFKRLEERVTIVRDHKAFNLGVHDTLKETTLHISNNDGQSSSILPLKLHSFYHPEVKYVSEQLIKLVRIDNFINENRINIDDFNFVNIDVQGVELNVIKSFGDLIKKIDYIYTEINEDELYEKCCLVSEIDEYLKGFDFMRVHTKMTKCKWGDAFYIRKDLL